MRLLNLRRVEFRPLFRGLRADAFALPRRDDFSAIFSCFERPPLAYVTMGVEAVSLRVVGQHVADDECTLGTSGFGVWRIGASSALSTMFMPAWMSAFSSLSLPIAACAVVGDVFVHQGPTTALSRCHAKSASGLRLTHFQAAASASRHVVDRRGA